MNNPKKQFFVYRLVESQCNICGTTKKPHKALGYCEPCYRNFLKTKNKRAVDKNKKEQKTLTK